ncbi:RAD52 motif-containing protein 1 isoform X3 [Centrocercus urophasianus]|uniref:RAD52 motif-containing protein 1 isoform X3 n=1 Tax=Centrocercus urophasianus TaxID=9002 RepID=UPI001C652FFB|nr:RAD52 motif-containing protein 1 isoform X3 [Centrocercus urophasianus]
MKLLKCVTELQQSPQKARGQREGAGQPLGTHGCSIRCTFFSWFVCCLCFCVGLLFCLLVCLFPKHALFSVFSKFGLLYSVRAHSNAAVAGPGCYAIIKFYSAADASRAQQACNGQKLFQNSPMKVCVCTKQKGFQQQVLALNSNKCQELANHYLGFNGWCSRIITPSPQLQNVSGFDDENEEVGKKRCVRYLCAVEVTLPNHGVQSRGVGLGEADVGNGEAAGRVQKLAVGKALSSAFQKILLVVLGAAGCVFPGFHIRCFLSLQLALSYVITECFGPQSIQLQERPSCAEASATILIPKGRTSALSAASCCGADAASEQELC